jgi:hypothetical protein
VYLPGLARSSAINSARLRAGKRPFNRITLGSTPTSETGRKACRTSKLRLRYSPALITAEERVWKAKL